MMSDKQDLFKQLWHQYCEDTPKVKEIYHLFLAEEGEVINDHIALRTFDDPRVNIPVLAKPFIERGYVENGQYDFPNKKLFAKHFEHADPKMPKVFISELMTQDFSDYLQKTSQEIVDAIPDYLLKDVDALLMSGVSWQPIKYAVYEKLLAESEYAAWLYAFGFRANHFTVSVNHLKKFKTIQSVNAFLKKHAFELNTSGGEIKGTPSDLLEQSSTLAFPVTVNFMDGQHEIPLAYYEFALRYPKPDGHLYSGFVAASADKIFESTDKKR
jgi:hypothetical protein